MKAAALRGALSDRAREDRVKVVDALVPGDTPNTKSAVALLKGITEFPNVLVVLQRNDEVSWKSLRNVPTVHLLEVGQLNTYDVLVNDVIVFTRGAYDQFVAGPAKGKSATATARSSEVEGSDA
jgi:large subunit ribosomal protein L4